MKKILMGTAVAALALTVGVTGAFAAGGRNYVDADGDGICDNRGSWCAFADADGDGVCDYHGTNCRYGGADGICDNYGAGCHRQGRGHHGW